MWCTLGCRAARWFVFKPKIQIWVSFGGSCNRKSWCILWALGLFYGHWKIFCGHSVYFVVVWYVVPRKIWQPCSAVYSTAHRSPFKVFPLQLDCMYLGRQRLSKWALQRAISRWHLSAIEGRPLKLDIPSAKSFKSSDQ
jgi:hypothetical protein